VVWVKEAKERSGLPIVDILRQLDIAPSTYYRVRKSLCRQAGNSSPAHPSRRNLYELLPEERMLIIDYALTYPNPRHRELT